VIELTMGWIASATRGRLAAGEPTASLGEVVTDSRTLGKGDFFVALKGPRHDGHDHVLDALARGASGALVSHDWLARAGRMTGGVRSGGLIAVDDTLAGLQDMARALRRASGTRVVAITGSAGKTTTKEAIADMLATRWDVVKNKGNLNNHIGLPLSLMQLRQQPDVAVMELGMNHHGEISALVGMADPDVRVWTNVGDAHLGYFQSADDIADAKAEILEGATMADILVCNVDDPRVMKRAAGFPGKTVTFGYGPGANVRAVDVQDLGVGGMRARLVTAAVDSPIQTGLLGRGNLANVLAAAAVAIEFGVPVPVVVDRARAIGPAPHRGSVHVVGGVTVVDDSYNSSPSALAQALEVLAAQDGRYRKAAVLGEMLELGAHAERLHRESGVRAAGSGLAWLVTVGGGPARLMGESAVAAGMPSQAVRHVERSEDAADLVPSFVRDGDLVLVKGSRGVRTDLVVERLLEAAA
jgi:UDP-N-acetylmuramoyl-tripeptide--D-alanyl-D-alanine ligase